MKFRRSLFWDTDPKTLDINKNKQYIIERILEYGDTEDVRWCIKTYGAENIKQYIPHMHLNDKSRSFWLQYL